MERLAEGEISRDEYRELTLEITAGVAPVETAEPGATPTPVQSSSGAAPVGPSGAETRLPRLAALRMEPGTMVLEQWRVVRELGRGGFGAVFEVEDIKLERTFALKVLDPSMVANGELLARFRREVTLMRDLTHPRIVRVYDYREDPAQDLALITMEFIRGCTVRELLLAARASGGKVPVSLALDILRQTLEGLAAAELQGIVHRDVTPGNILLAGGTAARLLAEAGVDPQVKLVDFGIAGLAEPSELSARSRVLGTAAYVAPEVLDPEAVITAAADVYGAGAVAYELLTGKPPVVAGHRPVAELREDVSDGDSLLISSTVSTDPAARPTAAQALVALNRGGAPPSVRQASAAGPAASDESRAAAHRTVAARNGHGREDPTGGKGAPGSTDTSAKWRTGLRIAAASAVALLVAVSWFVVANGRKGSGSASGLQELPRENAWLDTHSGMRFKMIPPGSFEMGSPPGEIGRREDERQTEVVITRGFWIGETEVTQLQWRAVTGGSPSRFDGCGDDCPVENVSWWDTLVFANAMSAEAGVEPCYELSGCTAGGDDGGTVCRAVEFAGLACRGYRLPTEAEWEYAARAGSTTPFWAGDTLGTGQANYNGNYPYGGGTKGSYRAHTRPVRSHPPNSWGLFDVSGNVWEWCWDRYGEYSDGAVVDPLGPTSGADRVERGGGWFSLARDCRSANRSAGDPSERDHGLGLRLVRCVP